MRKNSDLILRFNNIKIQAQNLVAEYNNFFRQAEIENINYQIKINDSFIKYLFYQYGDTLHSETLNVLAKDLPKLRSLKKYSVYNVFATLRIMTRKQAALNKENNLYLKKFNLLLKDVKKLEQDIDERGLSQEESHIMLDFLDLKDYLLAISKTKLSSYEHNYDFLTSPFYEGGILNKQEFLQVITIAKDKERWDGTPTTPYAEVIKEIPDIIDFETFRDLIFIQKIEDDWDCYLFDIFMNEMLVMSDKYKEQTGKSLAFEALEKISGKPIQTYTAEIDEYGDVVSLEPNKPNLRAIEGGRKND